MDYYKKYLKYKNKYLRLKSQIGGMNYMVQNNIKKFNELEDKSDNYTIDMINRKRNRHPKGELEVHKWVNLTKVEDMKIYYQSFSEPTKSITNNLVEELKREIKKDFSITLNNQNYVITYLRALDAYILYNHNRCPNIKLEGKQDLYEPPETCNQHMQELTKSDFHNKISFKNLLVQKLKSELKKPTASIKLLIKKESDYFEKFFGLL
jgi:hypothetical protein